MCPPDSDIISGAPKIRETVPAFPLARRFVLQHHLLTGKHPRRFPYKSDVLLFVVEERERDPPVGATDQVRVGVLVVSISGWLEFGFRREMQR